MYILKLFISVLVFIAFPVSIYAQTDVIKPRLIKLKHLKESKTVVINYDSIIYYLKTGALINFLKHRVKLVGNKDDSVLLARLKKNRMLSITGNLTFDMKTQHLDWSVPNNYYLESVRTIIPRLLTERKAMIYIRKDKVFLNKIKVSFYSSSDFLGGLDIIKAFYSNGNIIDYWHIRTGQNANGSKYDIMQHGY